jgi:hypothetical protein
LADGGVANGRALQSRPTDTALVLLAYVKPFFTVLPRDGRSTLGVRQLHVRRLIQLAISALAVAVILFGARYGIGKERLHDVDLRQLYLQMNDQYFNGELDKTVPVNWGDPGVGYDAVTNFYGKTADSATEIIIDRSAASSEERLRFLMGHESCHLKTRPERLAGQDAHGEAWQSCMERFK